MSDASAFFTHLLKCLHILFANLRPHYFDMGSDLVQTVKKRADWVFESRCTQWPVFHHRRRETMRLHTSPDTALYFAPEI